MNILDTKRPGVYSGDKSIGGFLLTCRSDLSTLIYNQHTELSFDSFDVFQKKGG